jgi:hypothetical protein
LPKREGKRNPPLSFPKVKKMKEKTTISLTIPRSLLTRIEENIDAKSRSEKIVKCVAVGYQLLTKGE